MQHPQQLQQPQRPQVGHLNIGDIQAKEGRQPGERLQIANTIAAQGKHLQGLYIGQGRDILYGGLVQR